MFGDVKLTKNADADKYSFSEYSIGFDSPLLFSVPNFDWGKNAIIFEMSYSSSVHIDNKKEDILYLVEGPTSGLDDTTIITEAKCSINFTRLRNIFAYVFIIMNATTFYLLILQKYINSKQKALQ